MTESLATLEKVKEMLGITGNAEDEALQFALESAHHWVCERVMNCEAAILEPDVQYAIALLASRWYKRRQSPEGVLGMNEYGVVRISYRDPDILSLLERHLEYRNAGIA